MTGILADHNLVGHVEVLVRRLESPPWDEFWGHLGLRTLTLADLGLDRTTPDDVIWRRCQADGLILLTGNRNHDGPDSLEAVIRAENGPASLPVVTIGTADDLLRDRSYLDRVTDRFIHLLYDIESFRGTGRLFLP